MVKTIQNNENIAQNVWAAYENSCSYMDSIGMRSQIQKNIDFYEGRQWPKPTKDTLGMPRPVIDITSFTVDNKRANISGTPVKITFTSTDEDKAKTLNQYTEYWCRRVKFKNKLKKAVCRAEVDCGACFHVFYQGGKLKLELIDVRNLHVSDPTGDDLQEMDWIIISSRLPLSAVKKMADKDVDLEDLTEDTENITGTEKIEQKNSKLCTVLTRYFRRDGEVYFEKTTKTTVINKARPIAPKVDEVKETEAYLSIAAAVDAELPTEEVREPINEVSGRGNKSLKAELYPVWYWKYREKRGCFYGQSLVETLISDQKAINTSYGILLLGAQIEATGKTFVKSDALRGQELTNNPLQVVVDYHASGQGVYKLSPAQLNSAGLTLIDTLVKYVRFTNNVTEINTGEAYGANASGSAIAQLQSQASGTTDTIREDLWEELEEFGLILKQEFGLYFRGETSKTFRYTEEIPDQQGVLNPTKIEGKFNGEQYDEEENTLFDVQIKAVKGTRSSVSGDIQMLEAMLQAQMLSAIEFIEMYPEDALTEKDRLLSVLKAHSNEQLSVLQQKLAKSQQDNKQLVALTAQLSNTIKLHKETMEAAYKVLNVEESVKKQALMEGAKRMNAEASFAMAEQSAQQASSALNAMAADVVDGKIGSGIQPMKKTVGTQIQRKSLTDLEEEI